MQFALIYNRGLISLYTSQLLSPLPPNIAFFIIGDPTPEIDSALANYIHFKPDLSQWIIPIPPNYIINAAGIIQSYMYQKDWLEQLLSFVKTMTEYYPPNNI